jgi:outer membrane protein assembly factor BamB
LRAAVAALVLSAPLAASDWPQFLGPTRDGVYVGAPLNEKWPAAGPRVIWRKQVGQGLSGPVAAGQRLILFHRIADREVVESFDRLSGAPQWRHAYPTAYRDDFGFDEGPRAVPVVADGIVYTYGAEGKLHAVDLATGKPLWNVDAMRQFEVDKGFFGAAGSPLVEDGKVIANVGGKKGGIVAFDAKTGKVIWTSTVDGASYSSGTAATIAG